jgi:hypothetical protein
VDKNCFPLSHDDDERGKRNWGTVGQQLMARKAGHATEEQDVGWGQAVPEKNQKRNTTRRLACGVSAYYISHSCDLRTTIYMLNINLLVTNYFLGINS